MLKVQRSAAAKRIPEDADGHINRRAMGYIYGFIDAALSTTGQDMSDVRVSVPITYQVLERVFPGSGEKYVTFLSNNIGRDQAVTLGMTIGGQQYLDFCKSDSKGAPMGLARYLIEGDKPT